MIAKRAPGRYAPGATRLRKDQLLDAAPSRSPLAGLRAAGLVVLLFGGLTLLFRLQGHRESRLVNTEAPDFRLAVVANGIPEGGEGSSLNLRDLRGRPVILDFWATWCSACAVQAPSMERAALRWRDKGVLVVGISTDGLRQGNPRAFAASHGLSYPIVQDPDGVVLHSYDVDSLPTTVFVSPAGRVVAVRAGVTDEAEIDRLIRQSL